MNCWRHFDVDSMLVLILVKWCWMREEGAIVQHASPPVEEFSLQINSSRKTESNPQTHKPTNVMQTVLRENKQTKKKKPQQKW